MIYQSHFIFINTLDRTRHIEYYSCTKIATQSNIELLRISHIVVKGSVTNYEGQAVRLNSPSGHSGMGVDCPAKIDCVNNRDLAFYLGGLTVGGEARERNVLCAAQLKELRTCSRGESRGLANRWDRVGNGFRAVNQLRCVLTNDSKLGHGLHEKKNSVE